METEPCLIPKSKIVQGALGFGDSYASTSPATTAPFGGGAYITQEEVHQMFEKKFRYQHPLDGLRRWQLAKPTNLFSEYYQLDSLQELKQRLNTVKCKLNNYVIEDWSAHTKRTDPSSEIPWRLKTETNAEFVTVAWCKFYECLCRFPLVSGPQLNSLHLCEAPGAFITSLNHFLYSCYKKEEVCWNWLSTTLNPYYEGNPVNKMIVDDRFMLHTLNHWLFHDDFSGNIISLSNLEQMQHECSIQLNNSVNLITADGSIDCVDTPDCQEETVGTLHFAELTTALSILSDGGCYVMKMFTLFEATSVCKMYLLNCVFDEVHVFKPTTSKRGNSELYIIGLGYRKQTPYLRETLEQMRSKLAANVELPLFPRNQLPADFLLQHELCVRLFMNLQINAIESNIFSYEVNPGYSKRRSHLLRSLVSQEFYRRYEVQPIPPELTIVQHQLSQPNRNPASQSIAYRGSYTEREILKANHSSTEKQIFVLRSNLNEIARMLHSNLNPLLDEHLENVVPQSAFKVYRGAPYTELHSSLFVSMNIMLLRNKLQKLYSSNPIWASLPKCLLNGGESKEIQLQLNEQTNFMQIQRNFILQVLVALKELQPQQIVLQNMPFLTHFSVSVLRYLALRVFKTLVITTEPTFAITLTCWCDGQHYQEDAKTALNQLYDLLLQEERVLCVLDIVQLHRNAFCEAITVYNNKLLLHNFELMLNKEMPNFL